MINYNWLSFITIFSTLAQAVGILLGIMEHQLIAGSFWQHIDVEKTVEIGMLLDLSTFDAAPKKPCQWEQFKYRGNTLMCGVYSAGVCRQLYHEVRDIADRVTCLGLSTDNGFCNQYVSTPFPSHMDIERFSMVKAVLEKCSNNLDTRNGASRYVS